MRARAGWLGADHAGRHGADARMHARQGIHEPGLRGRGRMERKAGAPRRRVSLVRRGTRAREPEPDSDPDEVLPRPGPEALQATHCGRHVASHVAIHLRLRVYHSGWQAGPRAGPRRQ
jgi:hypothetical protein